MTPALTRLSLALLALGLVVAAISAVYRVQADEQARQIMVLVDWRELNALSAGEKPESNSTTESASGLPKRITELLADLPSATLAYGEETVGDLLMQGILRPSSFATSAPSFEVASGAYAGDIAAGADRHGYALTRHDGRLQVTLPLTIDAATTLPLAWRSDVIEAARASGVPLLLRPGGTRFMGERGIERTLRFTADQPLVLFQGSQVLGHPHELRQVADLLRQQRQAFGWVEFDDQAGGARLAALMAPQVVRVHSITPEEMRRYTIPRAVDRFELAVSERGIRAIFLRPFPELGVLGASGDASASYAEQLRSHNRDYFAGIAAMLAAKGITVSAEATVFQSNPPAWLVPLRTLAAGAATGAAAALLLWLWVPALGRRWVITLLALGVLAGVGSVVFEPLVTLTLLATGIFFPLLGFWSALLLYQRLAYDQPAWSFRRLGAALLALLSASAVSAAGGLLIHGAMWDVRSMLHLDQFRGVTLTLAIPALLLAAYAWQAETLQDAYDAARLALESYWQRFIALWTAPIRYGDVAFILLAVGALGVVLLRSGNEGPFGALAFEGALRSWLESALDVRPRTKELLGHAALVLFLLTIPLRTRLGLLLALGGILGQVSILNTFCHLHTPLDVTLKRVMLGLILGLVSAAFWGLLLLTATRLLCRRVSTDTDSRAA